VRVTPRYGGPPVIDVSDMRFDPTLVIHQRDRLVGVLSQLSADEWATSSRCEGWSVQDVAEHLVGVNQFWVVSIGAGLRNEPSRLLESFDPVNVPAAMVERARGAAPATTLDRLAASNAKLAALLSSLSEGDLAKVAEAPPGHLAISGVAGHALWDAWVHERDVLLPLGREQAIERDEVAIVLAHVAALGSACYLNAGEAPTGSLAVKARNPSLELSVQISDQVRVHPDALIESTAIVDGDAVEIVELLSCRAPRPVVSDDHRWLVDGLSRVFDPAV
jgi:uncharacterized protein (TIGR03083 family)